MPESGKDVTGNLGHWTKAKDVKAVRSENFRSVGDEPGRHSAHGGEKGIRLVNVRHAVPR